MHIFEVHWNESACRKKVPIGLEQVLFIKMYLQLGIRNFQEGWDLDDFLLYAPLPLYYFIINW